MIPMPGKLKSKTKILTFKWTVAAILLAVLIVGIGPADIKAEVQTDYLYSLSNFSGTVPLNLARIHFDENRSEMYVTDTSNSGVRIFNAQGMEIYRFGDDWNLGSIIAAVVREDGNILVLSQTISKNALYMCNFRGEVVSELALKNLPSGFEGFSPGSMFYQHQKLYLLESNAMRLLVTDANGVSLIGYDLAALTEIEEKKRSSTAIGGFSVDRQGNILFTIPVLFSAFKLTPDGKLSGFGRPGSAPGRFNNTGGIVADDRGYYYVADRLKSAVLIFDKNFKFVKEFGYRGRKPDNLAGPWNLGLDADNRLYVSQLASRGVSVFKITYK
jgi:DNA-binding beta-propeller fold protein YncE